MSLKNTQTVERNIAAAIHIINNTKTGITISIICHVSGIPLTTPTIASTISDSKNITTLYSYYHLQHLLSQVL